MNSFIGWIGGKSRLRKYIIPMISDDATRYIEVFGGAGWVLFGKDKKPKQLEVINDINGNFVNLYLQIKNNCDELQREIDWIQSRELFCLYHDQLKYNVTELSNVQRAARFYYIVKCSFGAARHSFATTSNPPYNIAANLSAYSERLKDVLIEHEDFAKLIKTYDRDKALFYLDPPYYGTEKYYKCNFGLDDHIRLNACLKGIKGRFILSYNDCDFIRELYNGYKFVEVNRKNTLSPSGNNKTDYAELLITNF